ncbi:MAG: type II secretion system F family protein [Pseudomonadota bacterium]
MMQAMPSWIGVEVGPVLVVIFALMMLVVFSLSVWAALGTVPDARRYAPQVGEAGTLRAGTGRDKDGIDRYLLPQTKKERWQVQRLLHRAGFRAPDAVRRFYVVRLSLALIGLVGAVIAAVVMREADALRMFGSNSLHATLLMVGVGVLAGFYGPLLWVRRRASARQVAMRRALPDALDLLQVMIQAGLGLDAALQRVGVDLRQSCPPLAEELNLLVLELRAGKSREQALDALAERIELPQVRAFVTVLTQSLRYGTSVSDALEAFAVDMRNERMMRAEELANQLPVKMSVVLVLFMLPAVIAVAMGPVIIRVVRVVAPAVGA